jgi:hypothetical protein
LLPGLGLLSVMMAAPHPVDPAASLRFLGFFRLFPLSFLGMSLITALRREEWRAGPGMLEVRRETLGAQRVWRYTDATLSLGWTSATRNSGAGWRLYIQGSTGRRLLTTGPDRSWNGAGETDLLILARLLSETTRFPIVDGPVEIRHQHTGRVLRRVRGGTLVGARLAGSRLAGAGLDRADLRGADLRGTDLRGASLIDADVTGARLQGLRLPGIEVVWALLIALVLLDGFLRCHSDRPGGLLLPAACFLMLLYLAIRLRLGRTVPTRLAAADLAGADLTATELTGAHLEGATYDARTKWPVGFDPHRHGAILSN